MNWQRFLGCTTAGFPWNRGLQPIGGLRPLRTAEAAPRWLRSRPQRKERADSPERAGKISESPESVCRAGEVPSVFGPSAAANEVNSSAAGRLPDKLASSLRRFPSRRSRSTHHPCRHTIQPACAAPFERRLHLGIDALALAATIHEIFAVLRRGQTWLVAICNRCAGLARLSTWQLSIPAFFPWISRVLSRSGVLRNHVQTYAVFCGISG